MTTTVCPQENATDGALHLQALAASGWRLIPIRLREKNPGGLMGKGWQDQASNDPDVIQRWLSEHSPCNWGVLLGESSGIIDIEDDSPEGREILDRAMEEAGVRTLCYQSARSIHRLFLIDDRIKQLSATIVKACGTEWRFGTEAAAQSVIPPSVHDTGARYRWLPGCSPDDVQVASLPDSMWQLMLDLKATEAERKRLEREAKKGSRKSQASSPVSPSLQAGSHTQHTPAAEDLAEQISWNDLLTQQGWSHFDGDMWTRPGDDWTNAKSASICEDGTRLQVWSEAAPIDPGRYSKWRFWYASSGFGDREQLDAARCFLGADRSRAVDNAYRKSQASIPTKHLTPTTESGRPVLVKTFAGIDAAELHTFAAQEPDWLVRDIFTIDEPLLVGARSKCCKTLQLTDLAVAVASGTKWMDTFDVPKRRKVLFISGETNQRRMARHIEKACRSRGIAFEDLRGWLRVEALDFPVLPSLLDREAIREDIAKHDFEFTILDPLYRGLSGTDASRLNEVAPAIKLFQAACVPSMLTLSHHVVKSAAKEYGSPPQLEDMTGAGIAESCGQWWLVGRNEKYQWNWKHDLCVQFGGREGQGGGRRILFNEYDWTFQVESLSEFRDQAEQEQQQRRDDARRNADEAKVHQARQKILKVLRAARSPLSRSRIRDDAGLSGTTLGPAFCELMSEGTVVQRTYIDGAKRIQPEGYILSEYADDYDQKQSSSEMTDDDGR